MLHDEVDFAHVAVLDKEWLGESDARIEVEVGHRHGVFEHVPEALLGIEQEEVCAERQGAARETLRNRYLKFYICVVPADSLANRASENEVIVLVEAEIRTSVECLPDAVAIDIVVAYADNL